MAHLEGLAPGGLGAWLVRVERERVQSSLKQEKRTVHDAHDEVGWLAQLADSGDVSSLDGLQSCLCLLQSWTSLLQLLLRYGLISLHRGRTMVFQIT